MRLLMFTLVASTGLVALAQADTRPDADAVRYGVELESDLRRLLPTLEACNRDARRTGKMDLSVSVERNGAVVPILIENGTSDAGIAICVVASLRSMRVTSHPPMLVIFGVRIAFERDRAHIEEVALAGTGG